MASLCLRSQLLVLCLLLGCCLPSVLADTPANCTYDSIVGTWDFHVGPPSPYANLSCDAFTAEHVHTVTLSFPDVASDGQGRKGFFTLVYNQGFEVRIAGRSYFAFSQYTTLNDSVQSLCHLTFNGWAHAITTPETDWRCYFGVKNDSAAAPRPSAAVAGQPSRCATTGALSDPVRLNRRFRHDQAYIDAVNSAQVLVQGRTLPGAGALQHRRAGAQSGRSQHRGRLGAPAALHAAAGAAAAAAERRSPAAPSPPQRGPGRRGASACRMGLAQRERRGLRVSRARPGRLRQLLHLQLGRAAGGAHPHRLGQQAAARHLHAGPAVLLALQPGMRRGLPLPDGRQVRTGLRLCGGELLPLHRQRRRALRQQVQQQLAPVADL